MRVLIIEDNENKYKDIKESLDRVCSPWITWCKSRNYGLATFIKCNEKGLFEPYDLVITDNIMPLYDDDSELEPFASDIVDEIRRRGFEDIPIIVCSSGEVEECDYNYFINYDPSISLDETFEIIITDIKAYKALKQIDMSSRKDMEIIKPKNEIDYEGVVGKAILKHRTEINDYCASYDPFGLCNILECLYCENAVYQIILENGEGIINSEKDLNLYPNDHSNGMIDDDHEILFYDYVPTADNLYSYLFSEDSKYKIIRKSDNVIMVDTTKKANVKKLVPKE